MFGPKGKFIAGSGMAQEQATPIMPSSVADRSVSNPRAPQWAETSGPQIASRALLGSAYPAREANKYKGKAMSQHPSDVDIVSPLDQDNAAAFRPGNYSVRVVTVLAVSGTMRFSQIRRTMKLSAKTLSANLRELERNGLITRRAYLTIPPRVEYSLSEVGRDFAQLIEAWDAFLHRSRNTMVAARGSFDASLRQRHSPPASR